MGQQFAIGCSGRPGQMLLIGLPEGDLSATAGLQFSSWWAWNVVKVTASPLGFTYTTTNTLGRGKAHHFALMPVDALSALVLCMC